MYVQVHIKHGDLSNIIYIYISYKYIYIYANIYLHTSCNIIYIYIRYIKHDLELWLKQYHTEQ